MIVNERLMTFWHGYVFVLARFRGGKDQTFLGYLKTGAFGALAI